MAPGMLCWLSQLRIATENDRVEVVSRVSDRTVTGDQSGGEVPVSWKGDRGRNPNDAGTDLSPICLTMLVRT